MSEMKATLFNWPFKPGNSHALTEILNIEELHNFISRYDEIDVAWTSYIQQRIYSGKYTHCDIREEMKNWSFVSKNYDYIEKQKKYLFAVLATQTSTSTALKIKQDIAGKYLSLMVATIPELPKPSDEDCEL